MMDQWMGDTMQGILGTPPSSYLLDPGMLVHANKKKKKKSGVGSKVSFIHFDTQNYD
jgi:hypothetical protein